MTQQLTGISANRLDTVPAFAGLDTDSARQIAALAATWAASPERPRARPEVLAHWRTLIAAWLADPTMPLIVRKSALRGAALEHLSGRIIVCADNSPAHWAFSCALHGGMPTLAEARAALTSGALPICMVPAKGIVPAAAFPGRQGKMREPNLNKLGWQVAHIERVGLNDRADLAAMPLERLVRACGYLLDPCNMFLIPKVYWGLGELPEYAAAFRVALVER